MSSSTPDSLKTEIEQGRLATGNYIVTATGAVTTASSNLYVDSSGKLESGSLPFVLPLYAGSASTSYAALAVSGYATLSADEVMHNTLVAGAGVTTWTKTGFLQIDVYDAAGNITNGKHYIQFGTLS